jgi:hypothetical protein
MAGTGGARPGAGRKPKKEKYAAPINKAERQIVDKLPQLIEVQMKLAFGGIPVIEEKWIPRAAFSFGDLIAKEAGKDSPEADKAIEDPYEMVLAERKVSHTLPDRAAGQYLIDRIAGKPTQKIKDEDGIEKVSLYGQLIRELRTQRGLEDDDTEVFPDNVTTDNGAG